MRLDYIKLAGQIGAVLMVFMATAPFAYAYTLVNSPATPLRGQLNSQSNAHTAQQSGGAGSLITYVEYNSSVQSSSDSFYIQLESGVGFTPIDCKTATTTFADIGAPGYPSPGDSSVAEYRIFALYGTQCNLTSGTFYAIHAHATGGTNAILATGSTTVAGVDDIWFLITTDTASSTIYEYQDDILAIATSSTATYCNSTFAPISLGGDIANGMCNVVAFLFVPSSQALNAFGGLGTQLQSKIPFSYVYELQTIFSGLSASSTGNLSAVTINFPQIGSTTPLGAIVPSTITALSTTTISTYLPDGVRNSLLSLQRIALWCGFILLIYRRIIPHHVIEQKV